MSRFCHLEDDKDDTDDTNDSDDTDDSGDNDDNGDNDDYIDYYRAMTERFYQVNGSYQSSNISCQHCQNRCRVICNECNKSYGCHKCHNEKEDHELKTKKIVSVICMECNEKQPFSDKCTKCKITFASYVCFECNVMMNVTPHLIFHCSKCKGCMIKDNSNINYIHCDLCDTCINSNNMMNHNCKKKTDTMCSICLENSRNRISVIMTCGHVLHQDCYEMLTKTSYKCPICSKSIKNTADIFQRMRKDIAKTPLGPELSKNIKIKCHDCAGQSTVKFHYIGNECCHCKSFNTYILD